MSLQSDIQAMGDVATLPRCNACQHKDAKIAELRDMLEGNRVRMNSRARYRLLELDSRIEYLERKEGGGNVGVKKELSALKWARDVALAFGERPEVRDV